MFESKYPQLKIPHTTVIEPIQVIRARKEILLKLEKEENLRRLLEVKPKMAEKQSEKDEKVKLLKLEPVFLQPFISIKEVEKKEKIKEEEKTVKPIMKKRSTIISLEPKQTLLGHSNFEFIKPEVGVTISEGMKVKNGGNNFLERFGKYSIHDFRLKRVFA